MEDDAEDESKGQKLLAFGTGGPALGLGQEVFSVATPTLVPVNLDHRAVREISSSKHTLMLMEGGAVLSAGRNDYGQVGRESQLAVPRPISGLDAFFVTSVACGEDYSVVAVSTGRVFSWGRVLSTALDLIENSFI